MLTRNSVGIYPLVQGRKACPAQSMSACHECNDGRAVASVALPPLIGASATGKRDGMHFSLCGGHILQRLQGVQRVDAVQEHVVQARDAFAGIHPFAAWRAEGDRNAPDLHNQISPASCGDMRHVLLNRRRSTGGRRQSGRTRQRTENASTSGALRRLSPHDARAGRVVEMTEHPRRQQRNHADAHEGEAKPQRARARLRREQIHQSAADRHP
ncbi:hypothetical protein B0G69_2910 [Paraburkholderia sp. RAU2J]|nr:hypothetical protein B0G69_2910 [Paraburkholderia sp. RAU2J]